MRNYEARKQAKVDGQNLVNARIIELAKVLLPYLSQWVGKVPLLTGGNTSKKFRDGLPKFERQGFRWNVEFSMYNVWLKCDQFSSHDDGGFYLNQSVYLAEMEQDKCTVKKVQTEAELPKFRTDYTVKGIEDVQAQIALLEKKVSELKWSIDPWQNGLHGN